MDREQAIEKMVSIMSPEPNWKTITFNDCAEKLYEAGYRLPVEPQIDKDMELTPEELTQAYYYTGDYTTWDLHIALNNVAQAQLKKAYPVIRAKAYKEGWRKGDQFGIDSATEVDDVILEASVRDAIQVERAKVAKEIFGEIEDNFKWDGKKWTISPKKLLTVKSHYKE